VEKKTEGAVPMILSPFGDRGGDIEEYGIRGTGGGGLGERRETNLQRKEPRLRLSHGELVESCSSMKLEVGPGKRRLSGLGDSPSRNVGLGTTI